MKKQILSAILAFSMIISMLAIGAVSVSAETVGTAGAAEIYFDVKSSGWKNVKTVYCHVWRVDGTGNWPVWQSQQEKCTYNSETGIASYDLSKTGNIINSSDGNEYRVIFLTDRGMQIYNTIMNGACIGDTIYCTGRLLEHPVDSEKTVFEAKWRKNRKGGPERAITSSGKVIGSVLPKGYTNESLIANYIITYYEVPKFSVNLVHTMSILSVSSQNVYNVVVNILKKTGNPKSEIIKKAAAKALTPIFGDADGDKEITILDVTVIQKCVIESVEMFECDYKIFDVNNDGCISVLDATEIQKYLAELNCASLIGEPCITLK